jgi:hypothetical protein
MSKAPTCAYYESLFNQREHFNEKEEEDKDHAHLQRVNKNSNCEIIERGGGFVTQKDVVSVNRSIFWYRDCTTKF